MSHQWKAFYQWFNLFPYFGKYRSFIRVFMTKTMYLAAPIIIIVRFWLDERVVTITGFYSIFIGRFATYFCFSSSTLTAP